MTTENKNLQLLGIITSIVGVLSFFMTWISGGMFGNISGYSLCRYAIDFGANEGLLILLLPVAFGCSLLFKILSNSWSPTLVKLMDFAPLLIFSVIVFLLFKELGITGKDLSRAPSELFKLLGLGFYLTLCSSILLLFIPVREHS